MCIRALTVDASRQSSSVFVKDFRHFGDAQLRPREEHGALSVCSVFITVNRIGHLARPPSEDGYPRGETVNINRTLTVGASVLALTAIASFTSSVSASPVYRP